MTNNEELLKLYQKSLLKWLEIKLDIQEYTMEVYEIRNKFFDLCAFCEDGDRTLNYCNVINCPIKDCKINHDICGGDKENPLNKLARLDEIHGYDGENLHYITEEEEEIVDKIIIALTKEIHKLRN